MNEDRKFARARLNEYQVARVSGVIIDTGRDFIRLFIHPIPHVTWSMKII